MALSNDSLKTNTIPPKSPVDRPQAYPSPPQTLMRKRGRTSSPTLDELDTPTRNIKRLRGSKGPIHILPLTINVAPSRGSFARPRSVEPPSPVKRCSAPEPLSPVENSTPQEPCSPTERYSSAEPLSPVERPSSREEEASSERSGSALSFNEPSSPPAQVTESELRSSPISRSVIWVDRDSPKTSTPEAGRTRKINRFTPALHSDLIIRSNDARPVPFYVDTHTVYDASSVIRFRAGEIGSTMMRDSRPVVIVTVDEPAELIRDLLCLIYAHRQYQPSITSSEELDVLLGLAKRYRVSSAVHALCSVHLRDLAVHEPLRAFGLACKHDLRSEQVWTARETLRVNLAKADVMHDLGSCSADQITRLVKMHTRRATAAHNLIQDARSWDDLCCPGEHCQDGVAEWWEEVVRHSQAEFKRRPNSDVVFSPSFLAGCVRTAAASCPECPLHFFNARVQHRLAHLKDDIDALKATL